MSMTTADADALLKAIGANDVNQGVSNWLDTGYEPLNEIISGDSKGGVPYGRIVEIYGPPSSGKTALATKLMCEAQKAGGVAIFLDHERTFEVELAKSMGLNGDFPYFIYKRPKTWEESNNIAMKTAEVIREKRLIAPEAPIIAVFDSVAAMIPQSVFEKGIDQYTMNDTTALARVASTTLKAINAFTADLNVCTVYLNQVRMKPGVVYGDPTCLRGDVMIPFVDGTTMSIKEVVEQKIDKEVWSFNEHTSKYEPRRIEGWWDNGEMPCGERWVHIRAAAVDTKNGVFGVTVTSDHKLFTRDGWVAARDLTLSTELLTKQRTVLNGDARDFVFGVIAGDASVRKMSGTRKTAQVVIQDNNDLEYAKWKRDMLTPILGEFNEVPLKWGKDGAGVRFDSPFSAELCDLLPLARDPLALFADRLTPQMLALWIMDDGHFSTEDRVRYTVSVKRRKNDDYLDRLADLLFDKYGLRSRVRAREGALIFDTDSSVKIAEMIALFVPPCMERKLPESLRGQYVTKRIEPQLEHVQKWVRITDIREGSKHRGSRRYDVTVEGNHNYLVGNSANGVLVHNCTPGGSAFEFYASVRLSLTRSKVVEQKDGEKEFTGQLMTIEAKKTKLARPFQKAQLRLSFDDNGLAYFDTIHSLVEYAIEKGKLNYSKPRVTWTDGKQYFVKALVEKIKTEGLEADLKALF